MLVRFNPVVKNFNINNGNSAKNPKFSRFELKKDEFSFSGSNLNKKDNEQKIKELINNTTDFFDDIGIGISEEDLSLIVKEGNFKQEPELLSSKLSSMNNVREFVGKALFLALLKNKEIISDKTLDNNPFDFVDSIKDSNFKKILSDLGLGEEKINAIFDLCDSVCEDNTDSTKIKEVVENFNSINSNQIYEKIFAGSKEELKNELINKYSSVLIKTDNELKEATEYLERNLNNCKDYKSSLKYLRENLDNISRIEKLFEDKTIKKLYQEGAINESVLDILNSVSKKCAAKIGAFLTDEKLSKTLTFSDIYKLSSLDSDYQAEIIDLIKNDKAINYEDASRIALDEKIKERFDNFVAQGIETKTASILANIGGVENFETKKIVELLNSINATKTSNQRTSFVVEKFLKLNNFIDLDQFVSYIKKIDFGKIEKIAPFTKEFEPEQYLNFAYFWFQDNEKINFNKEDLTFDNVTTYFKDAYVDSIDLSELYANYPATNREIGEIPSCWMDRIEDKNQAQEDIYQAIDEFRTTKKLDNFSKKLSNILKKEVITTKIGNGIYGTVYRISIEGAQDVCLKLFDQIGNIACNSNKIHGEHIEPQVGLFVNEHSKDFVRMYFGKVSPNNTKDGFLVTQYLDENTKIDSSVGFDTKGWEITTKDADKIYGKNSIQNIIIDFGLVEIKKDGKPITSWSNL